MPIRKWINIGLNSDIKAVYISGSFDYLKAFSAIESLRNELIDTFGISVEVRKTLLIKMEIERLYEKLILQNDKSVMTFIKLKEAELVKETIQPKDSDFNYFQSVAAMIKEGLTRKDTETITVYEFYNNIKILDKWQKKE